MYMSQALVSFVLCGVFFFQAEDGIRDIGVTGVQTCALPISGDLAIFRRAVPSRARHCPLGMAPLYAAQTRRIAARSEERRVGKECRFAGSRCEDNTEREQST